MKRPRLRWISLGLLAVGLIAAAAVWHWFSSSHLQPWQFLAHVVQLEQAGIDQNTVQPLGWSLAILGRDDEVRELDFHPQFQRPPSRVDFTQLELRTVPWAEGLQQIAAEHRLVMIMEDHFVSKHREFIGATLPTFRDAGFTHYAAEAIGPLDTDLAERGYPTSRTGFYTSDPQFGNTLRRALQLKFTALGYDFGFTSHEDREESAANRLATLFQTDAETRLLVHAGHAHVLKYDTEHGGRWLAARLWDKTGIEPFTIWQWSPMRDAHGYAGIVRELARRGVELDEPLLLMPPPAEDSGLQDAPFGLAKVDAIVLHPSDDSAAPARRTVLFPDAMQRITGRWTGDQCPVVVSAYQLGEPVDAIPLDQVMLRDGETEFVLWIPAGAKHELRVFNRRGALNANVNADADTVAVGLNP